MHILFLPSWYPNNKSPYDGNFIQNKAKAVSKYAQVTVVFCTSFSSNDRKFKEEIFESDNLKEIIIYFPTHSIYLIRFFRKLIAYYIAFKKVSSYDVIHFFVFYNAGILATLIAIIKEKPLFYTEHSSYFHQFGFVKRWIFKILSKKTTTLILESKDLCQTSVRYGVSKDRILLIPTTIDDQHFRIIKTEPFPHFKFLHISKFEDPRKNVRGILNAVKRLSDNYDNFKIEFGGDGDISIVKKWAEELTIPSKNLIFSDRYRYQDLPQVYSSADCFVFFSNFENFGMVLAESMLCGLPVIATRVGGIPDFVNETNGILIDPKDDEALYSAMLSFLVKTKEYSSKNIRSTVVDYVSFDSIGKSHYDIYKKVLKTNNK